MRKKQPYFGLIGAIVIIMVCALVIGWAIPQQAEQFAMALFPWLRSDVKSAFMDLRENVIEGQPLSDAVTAFCLEIIHNAEQIE